MALTFTKITYKNIMSVGNNPITIELDKHRTTLITGSNGAGKSTLLEAISFVLFGKSFRKLTKPQLINTINKKNLLVEIDFKDSKHTYNIKRGMKRNIFEIRKNNNLIDEEANVSDYQDYLEKHILKMNMNTFRQIVILGTAGFTPFMLLNPGQRRGIIEDLLDISIFSTMTWLNKQQTKNVEDEIKQLEADTKRLIAEIRIHTNYEKERRQKSLERSGELNSSLSEITMKYNNIIQEISNLSVDLDKKSSELMDSVDSAIDEMKSTMAELKAEANQLKNTKEYIANNNHCNTCGQDIEDEHRSKMTETIAKDLKTIGENLISSKTQVLNLMKDRNRRTETLTEIEEIKGCISSKTTEKNMVASQKKSVQEELDALKETDEREDKTEEIRKLATQAKAKDKERKEQVLEKHCRDVIASILKDSGVKKIIIKKYIPSINTFINKYLKHLEANYNFILDEEFNETIKSRGRDTFSYSSFSQGERSRIDIAMLFAFRDLVSFKTGHMTNLLILDETLDSSADEEGINQLHKLLKKMNSNILIISHSEKHDKDRFDRHIQMEKIGNFTKMR